jgi:hypothetical protein
LGDGKPGSLDRLIVLLEKILAAFALSTVPIIFLSSRALLSMSSIANRLTNVVSDQK